MWTCAFCFPHSPAVHVCIYIGTYRLLLRRLGPIIMAGEIVLLRLTIKLPCVGRRRGLLGQDRDHFQGVVYVLTEGRSVPVPVPPEFARILVVPCSDAEFASVHVGESRDALL